MTEPTDEDIALEIVAKFQAFNAHNRDAYDLVNLTRRIKAALYSVRLAERERQWQPIETAPKDETPVLVTNGVAVGEAWRCDDDGNYWWANCYPTDATDGCVWAPTRWMPLPTPPAAIRETDSDV